MSFSSSVLELEKVNKEELNFFLLSEHHTLLYTSLPYFNLLKSFLNADIKIIVIRKKEKLVGYMPLAFKTDIQYGCVCNSLPFYGSNGGMVVSSMEDKDSIRTMLLNEYNDQVERKKCIASTVITNPLDKEGDSWLRENLIHDLVDERIGQITHFPITSEENIEQQLLSVFEDPRPRNIRKAQKDGVKIYTSNTKEALDFLYQIHHDNITAINGVSKKKLFFDMLPNFFTNEEYKIYIAELNGKKIAALLLFFYNQTVEYFTPAVVEKFRNHQPTALIIYQAMLDAIRLGYKNWNWGGTWLSQGGVYDFKKKWGTSDYRYFYYTKIYNESVYNMSKKDLLKNYSYFFVLPFSSLKQ